MNLDFDVRDAATEEDLDEVRSLFVEYQRLLDVDLGFQSFEEELATLPGKYAPPQGMLVLARQGGEVSGCVAVRPLEAGACEMKRLFVRDRWRGTGLGRVLGKLAIEAGRRAGFRLMRLDTLRRLEPALGLYLSLGFREVEAYYHNPLEGVAYLELEL